MLILCNFELFSLIPLSMAEVLGLFREEKPDDLDNQKSSNLPADILQQEQRKLGIRPKTSEPVPDKDENVFQNREIKRRTIYSAFILDKFLESGKDRRERIRTDQIKVQLPCSDEDFRFGSDVKTGHIVPDGIELVDKGVLDSSQVLSIYIRLVDILGKFMTWSCNGGRRYGSI